MVRSTAPQSNADLRRRRGAYGIDVPYVPVFLALGGLIMLGVAVLNATHNAGAIADIRATGEYHATLQCLGMAGVATRPLGWRFWYGGH